MKLFENKRNGYLNNYILLTQVLFFLLIGILLFRVSNITFETFFGKGQTVLFFVLLLSFVPLLQLINLKFTNHQVFWDLVINGIYMITAIILLAYEQGDLFKIVLLMPVIVMSLKYGLGAALFSAAGTSFVIFLIGYIKKVDILDIDIMLSSVIFLFAWLLGSMTESEHKIRIELERLANFDGLTDTYSYRSFHNILENELELAKNEMTNLSLIIVDIDYFRFYNDAYGHQEGDQILIQLAQLIKNVIGREGYCARYGGAEFAIILPKHDIIKGKEMGDRIRTIIHGCDFPRANIFPTGKLTISLGVVAYPLNAEDKDKLIKKAYETLYRSKFISENRVERYYGIFDEISAYLKEEEREMFNSIRAFTMVLNAKDQYTYGHSLRVMELAKRLAVRMEIKADLIQEITFGALLHDIGKVEISREILNKPSRLNQGEWEIFMQHPIWGADIIDPLKSLYWVKENILYHHENYDGTGYPEGVSGDNIPIGARILRIVDSYDAITTERSYKLAMSLENALEELKRYAGLHYDPVILEEFIKMMRDGHGKCIG